MAYKYLEPIFGERPKDVRIVDMCIFVDENFPKLVKEHNQQLEDTIVKYLYWIINSLAKTNQFFNRWEDYEDFSLFLAAQVFQICRQRLQNQGKIIRGKEVLPVKSCLNYIKSILYPYKVQYQQSNYSEVLHGVNIENPDQLQENLREEVRQQYRPDLGEIIHDLVTELPEKTYFMLEHQSPYKTDPTMIKRIYLSCMLTLIENITLKKKEDEIIDPKNYAKLYEKDRKKQVVILWHLPEHMEGYIRFLVYRIKRIISNELGTWRDKMNLSDEVVDSIIETAFVNRDGEDGDD